MNLYPLWALHNFFERYIPEEVMTIMKTSLIFQFNNILNYNCIYLLLVTQCHWSYHKIGNQITNIIDNQRKHQDKLKARLQAAEVWVWFAQIRMERERAAKVELELHIELLKKRLQDAENPTRTNFSSLT